MGAGHVDVVISLDTGIGPHSELHEYKEFLHAKCLVFVPDKYRVTETFAGTVYDDLKVFHYTPSEFETCTTIRAKANAFAQAIRQRKWEARRSQTGNTAGSLPVSEPSRDVLP